MIRDGRSTKLVRPLRSGQVTIPSEYRKRLGITDDSVLEMRIADGELRVRVLQVQRPNAGSPWLKELYDMFAPVRDEVTTRGYSDEEINAMIDAAVNAVREEHA